ncbi:rRNA processing [Phaffia rhodozyma]|uniref:rRNA processing n=1 Tax=Phaffia rhodozyma TaxID=264483 RepID=A0A0F7SW53_PHARH|nr:rRNA processing [Phaffia rhodozyma]
MAPPSSSSAASRKGKGKGKPDAGYSSRPQTQNQPPKKRGFQVGPKNAPKDAYLGKAQKIKANLIANAKTKRLYAKTLKQEGLESERLNRRPRREGRLADGTADDMVPDDKEEVEFDAAPVSDEEADDAQETAKKVGDVPPPLGFSTPDIILPPSSLSSSSSRQKNGYVPNTRRPQQMSSDSFPSRPAPSSTATVGQAQTREDRRRASRPAPDAKGKQRQPRMGDKMDSLLGKIRKGMS